MNLERSKELLINMINDLIGGNLKSCDPTDEEEIKDIVAGTIAYLFTLDFTEEELLELKVCTEDDIDNANAIISSAPEGRI